MPAFQRLVAWAVRMLTRALYGVEVRGAFVRHGRTLIVANHESFLDAVLLGAFLPVWPTYLVHTSIARRFWFRLGLKFVPHTVTDTTKPMAMKTLLQLVDSGQPVMIFPEGRITVTGSLMKIYDGPAFVAARSGCEVVPIHIEGAGRSPFRKSGPLVPGKRFPKITLTIHPPVTIPMPEGRRARDRRRKASEILRRHLQRAAYESRRRKTIWSALLDAAELNGSSRPVLADIANEFQPAPYKRLIKGALGLARLASAFTAEGETVGVLMPTANATVALALGLQATRRVPAMLNYTAGVRGIESACRAATVRTIVTSHAFVEKAGLEAVVGSLENLRVVYLEDLRAQLKLADKLWVVKSMLNPRAVGRGVRPEDPAIVMFTSGSEGEPKGVVLSHDSILANVAQINAAFPFNWSDRFMSALPLFHAFGFTAGAILPLLKGCVNILYPSPLHYRTVPEFVYDKDCTVLFTTNTFLSKYAKVAHPFDFYSLRYLVVGAEKMTDEVRELVMDKFGIRPMEGYGATECSPVIAVNTPFAYRRGTVGELLPGIEHKLRPVPGVERGGVLQVRGDNVMLGYLKADKPGQIQPVESGWYDTGDVVTTDDGFVEIQARLKRFAKVAGEMVSLEVVERIAAQSRPEALHAAVTYKDPARGETIVLFTDDRTLIREDLRAAARRMGAPDMAIPRRIVQLDEIPVLGNGKKDYTELTRLAGAPEEATA